MTKVSGTAIQEIEAAIPTGPSYLDLIRKVYLDPIRSAIVVDDNYPTLDDYLNDEVGAKSAADLLPLVKVCREVPRNWLVDVNDGNAIEGTEYKHLHQSDLMILDYHLEGDDGGGTKAINVLRSLAGNDYFNLVIVYTASNDVEETNKRILTLAEGLIYVSPDLDQGVLQVPQEITDWEEVDPDIVAKLDKAIDKETLLRFIQQPSMDNWKKFPGFEKIAELIKGRRETGVSVGKPTVEWLVIKKNRELTQLLSKQQFGEIEFSLGDSNWIKSNKLFVTVISKNVPPADLPEKLLQAIGASNPSPHQLLMTKIRNVLDEKGVDAEKTVLSKKCLQAFWLKEMLHAKEIEYPWQLNKTIDHHWNSLAAEINDEINLYGIELFNTIKSKTPFNAEEFIKLHTSIDISKAEEMQSISEEWNSFVSTKKSDTPYITTGLVFKISKNSPIEANQNSKEEYWVCLSPACDLVPGQKSRWAGEAINKTGKMPFKAVRLTPNNNGMKLANNNEFLFLKIESEIKSFCFTPSPGANPSWNQFFADNNGYFDANKFNASCLTLENSVEGIVKTTEYQAEVVTQLRYEYALNLLQKLGGSLSRIGLDFVSHS